MEDAEKEKRVSGRIFGNMLELVVDRSESGVVFGIQTHLVCICMLYVSWFPMVSRNGR